MSSAVGVRATDAEREWFVTVLHEAAGLGALTVEELDQRITAAYGATYQQELPGLIADLPPSARVKAGPAPGFIPAPKPPRPSRFWVWGFIPFLGAGAWVQAGLLTRTARYWLLAVVYATPLVVAIITAPGADDELPGWASGIAVAFWVANAIHAWMARPAVDADWARAQAGG